MANEESKVVQTPELQEGLNTYKGKLLLYSETGTEGGYWALQDERFTGIPDSTENCVKCGYMRDYIENPQKGDAPLQVVAAHTLSDVVAGKDSEGPCPDGDHEWKLLYPEGRSSYEGLHTLKDGDDLTILSPENPAEVVWQGTISLHQHPLFTESARGFWIHADQEGVDRETWADFFFKEYPARLVTKVPYATQNSRP